VRPAGAIACVAWEFILEDITLPLLLARVCDQHGIVATCTSSNVEDATFVFESDAGRQRAVVLVIAHLAQAFLDGAIDGQS
jgi:hypothetical protein